MHFIRYDILGINIPFYGNRSHVQVELTDEIYEVINLMF